jgi:hypothetical protein
MQNMEISLERFLQLIFCTFMHIVCTMHVFTTFPVPEVLEADI